MVVDRLADLNGVYHRDNFSNSVTGRATTEAPAPSFVYSYVLLSGCLLCPKPSGNWPRVTCSLVGPIQTTIPLLEFNPPHKRRFSAETCSLGKRCIFVQNVKIVKFCDIYTQNATIFAYKPASYSSAVVVRGNDKPALAHNNRSTSPALTRRLQNTATLAHGYIG